MLDETSRGTLAAIRSMARREAAALLSHPRLETWVTQPAVAVSLRIVPCPWPGCRPPHTQAGLLPIGSAEPLGRGERPRPGSVTLTALSCEWLAARSLWPLAQRAPGVPAAVTTRAAALVRLLGHGPPDGWVAALPELDARERWFDAVLGSAAADPAPGSPVLPASARGAGLARVGARHVGARDADGRRTAFAAPFASHVISPHLAGGRTGSLNDLYLDCRRSAVAAGLARAAARADTPEGRNGD